MTYHLNGARGKKWRDFVSRFGILSSIGVFLILLSGCASEQTFESNEASETMNKNRVAVIGMSQEQFSTPSMIDLLHDVKRVSVITPEGFELELDPAFWQDALQNNFDQLIESTSNNLQYPFTLLLRNDEGSPIVMQVGEKAISFADRTYTSTSLPQFILRLQGAIGNQILADLDIEHISITMLDVASQPISFNESEMQEIRKIIESASLILEPLEPSQPLYPHYVVQLLGGDKSVIHLDIIGNNIIAIPFGSNQRYYYYVNENLYAKFLQSIPPLDFLEDNPKSLFSAIATRIRTQDGEEYQFGDPHFTTLHDNSITDSIVRLLVDGKKQSPPQNKEMLYELIFLDENDERNVIVYADGYEYKGQYYHLRNIGVLLKNHLLSVTK